MPQNLYTLITLKLLCMGFPGLHDSVLRSSDLYAFKTFRSPSGFRVNYNYSLVALCPHNSQSSMPSQLSKLYALTTLKALCPHNSQSSMPSQLSKLYALTLSKILLCFQVQQHSYSLIALCPRNSHKSYGVQVKLQVCIYGRHVTGRSTWEK